MNHRRYISLGLFILMMGSTIFGLITMDALQTSVTKETEMDNEIEILNTDLQNNIRPSASAYYKTFTFGTRYPYSADTGLTNYFIMDMAEDATYYYYTGYSINNSNSNQSLFLMRASKASPGSKANYLNFQDGTNDTAGLCIDVDETRGRVYVGGYSGLNHTSINSSETFDSSLTPMVWCYNLDFTTQYWRKEFPTADEGIPWKPMYYMGINDIGGQRIEDLVALPDGNVSITGNRYDVVAKGAFVYVASLDGDNGNVIGEYHGIENPDNPLTDPFYSSVGRRIILDLENQRTISIALRKIEWEGQNFQWYNYLVFCYLNGTKIKDMWLDNGDQHAIIYSDSTYRNLNYPQVNDLFIAKDGVLWACGKNRSSTFAVDNQVVWQLNNLTGMPVTTTHFAKYNRTAEFMSIDVNGTLHLIGKVVNNASGQSGFIVQNFDLERNWFEINRTTYYYSTYKTILKTARWNNDTKEWTLSGYHLGATNQGFIQTVITSTYLPTETLTALDTYIHSFQVQLTWTQVHPELRFYKIYRETQAITLGNIEGFTAKTTINISAPGATASYIDTIPDVEGVEYCYALACTSDNITTLSAISTRNTTFYYAPDQPVPNVNPSWVRLNQNFTISNFQVANAKIELYESQSIFTKDDLGSMIPIFKDLTNNSVIRKPTALGAYYYMVNAYNTTERGNTTSDLFTVWCQDPAISPPSISITLVSSDDGTLRMSWDSTPMASYLVYGMVNYSFTIATQRASLTLVANTTTTQCNVNNWASGNWYFGVLGFNSSGEASSFSTMKNQTIKRTPKQPELRSPKGEASTNGEISLEWDNDTTKLTKIYKLYRIFTQDVNEEIDEDTFPYATLVYSGNALTFTQVVTENGYYIYLILAENENGHRVIDETMCVKISVRINAQAPIDMNLLYGLIGGGAIFAAGIIIYLIYKKKNPYF